MSGNELRRARRRPAPRSGSSEPRARRRAVRRVRGAGRAPRRSPRRRPGPPGSGRREPGDGADAEETGSLEGAASSENGAVAAPSDEAPSVEERRQVDERRGGRGGGGRAPRSEEPSEDPFAAWPQPQSGVVIEDVPAEGVSVEHVERRDRRSRTATPCSRARRPATAARSRSSSRASTAASRTGCSHARSTTLEEAGVAPDAVTVVPVPGAFELPLAAMALAKTRRYACVVALGAIVRGETPHFDYVASEAASGLQLAAIETGSRSRSAC